MPVTVVRDCGASTATNSTCASGPPSPALLEVVRRSTARSRPASSSTNRAVRCAQNRFHALPVEPAVDGRRRHRGAARPVACVSISAAQPVCHAGSAARQRAGGGPPAQCGAGGAGIASARGGIGRITRLGERLAGDGQNSAALQRQPGQVWRRGSTAPPTSPTVIPPPSASAAVRASSARLASAPSVSV